MRGRQWVKLLPIFVKTTGNQGRKPQDVHLVTVDVRLGKLRRRKTLLKRSDSATCSRITSRATEQGNHGQRRSNVL
nr:unnamed protein product [Haemonchus contortus]